jgi:P27 family predicted phage terminase small subunit
LKILEGNPGKRRLNPAEPKPRPKPPAMPSWLSREGKAEWRRVVPELDRIGLLTVVDRAALASYCEAWSLLHRAQADVEAHGVTLYTVEKTFEGEGGSTTIYATVAKNPAVTVMRDAMATIRSFCSEFGLSPSSRARMTVPEGAGEDDAASLLTGAR